MSQRCQEHQSRYTLGVNYIWRADALLPHVSFALSYAGCVGASCDFSLLIVVLCFLFLLVCLFISKEEREKECRVGRWEGGKVEEPVRG